MKDITIMYNEAVTLLNDLEIEVRKITSVGWNGRLKSVRGRCHHNRRTNSYWIELNPILASSDVSWENAMNTMIHEVLHAHEDRFCHTGEWKRCAQIINTTYPQYNITRCTSAEEKGVADMITKTVNYSIRCNDCGHVYIYARAGKVVKRIQKYPTSHGCTCACGSSNLSFI